MKKLSSIFCSIALLSSNTMAQVRSGRGEDWYYDDDGGGYFIYFLLIFWGVMIGVAVLKIIYDAILENYRKWFKSFKETLKSFLKILLMISAFMGVYILAIYLFVELDSKVPVSLEYVGGLVMCLFWLGIIRYLFFNNKSNNEIISFFKTVKGIITGIFIFLFMLALIFG